MKSLKSQLSEQFLSDWVVQRLNNPQTESKIKWTRQKVTKSEGRASGIANTCPTPAVLQEAQVQ